MSSLDHYRDRFANFRFERSEGILQVSLHTGGGPLQWGALDGSIHTQLGEAFRQVADDPDNRLVILTGSGDAFCAVMNEAGILRARSPGPDRGADPATNKRPGRKP